MRTSTLGICTEPEGFSAATVLEGRVVSAVEQFKIREHWSPREDGLLPKEAILASLQVARVDPSEIDTIVVTSRLGSPGRITRELARLDLNIKARLEQVDHRTAHAAAAFYTSPFDRAAV